jgi:probable rRNA maturation factor
MILIDPELKAELTQAAGRTPSLRSLNLFLAAAQSAIRLKGEVSVLLTTDTNQRALNRRFRRKNKTTDVLSFPASSDPEFAANKISGDLSISLPVARLQAAEQGHSLLTELKILILHGLLHLAGDDHESDSGQMAEKEELLRAKLKLPVGLIARVEGQAVKLASKTRRSRRS